ncbi:phytanoyl-CoA dioxygenase family protein [Pseudoalteromonas sp. 1_2015MBL_MicDiv]|uniref:phytanoyl-CoA dioxygenase family protein n=1 Tax=Pseudoalteromonas sp. 1_2015MBL_MicDiv TaxID=1720343 RepID=UPI000BBE4CB1|nr:phytanoyl-CoA dioxygenase family protein [Pseudoalteromonas sp. 1_2015MBL_MicDiv]ATG76502.1 hypothetical protein AOR04_02515 [Pseudoalteromonas sp. 1_2015MBL_MicDiv]
MKLVIVLIKELLESLIRTYRHIFRTRDYSSSFKEKVGILNDEGMLVENHFYSKETCKILRDKIDSMIDDEGVQTWIDDSASDHRIYFANQLDSDFNDFYNHPEIRKMLNAYTGTKTPTGMLLAARIDAKEGNLGSGGGWHRDSPITHQFKAVCYLSDVTEKNGPFQYIKASHKKFDVLKAYLSGNFKPGQYRFTEDEIDNYLEKAGRVVTDFTAEEGTIAFADTKGIHRGKPIAEGSRYVLFCYFWHGNIPSHFEKLRQK